MHPYIIIHTHELSIAYHCFTDSHVFNECYDPNIIVEVLCTEWPHLDFDACEILEHPMHNPSDGVSLSHASLMWGKPSRNGVGFLIHGWWMFADSPAFRSENLLSLTLLGMQR